MASSRAKPRGACSEPSLADLEPGAQGGRRQSGLAVHGSGNLAQTLTRHGFVDEYGPWVLSLARGAGRRLSPTARQDLHHRSRDGHLAAPAGEVVTDSFEPD
jgi:hypothetical protein